MKIYEIDQKILELLDQYQDYVSQDGEIVEDTNQLDSELANLQIERREKLINIALFIKSLQAEADAIKTEKQKLADRQSAKEKKIDSLKNYLQFQAAGEKIEDSRVVITYRKSEIVEVIGSAMQLPQRFQKIKIDIAKEEIKKAIKSGEVFDFAKLVEKQNLQIK